MGYSVTSCLGAYITIHVVLDPKVPLAMPLGSLLLSSDISESDQVSSFLLDARLTWHCSFKLSANCSLCWAVQHKLCKVSHNYCDSGTITSTFVAVVKVTWIYIVPSRESSKVLSHGSHSFTCKLHQCLTLPHKCSPDVATTVLW